MPVGAVSRVVAAVDTMGALPCSCDAGDHSAGDGRVMVDMGLELPLFSL